MTSIDIGPDGITVRDSVDAGSLVHSDNRESLGVEIYEAVASQLDRVIINDLDLVKAELARVATLPSLTSWLDISRKKRDRTWQKSHLETLSHLEQEPPIITDEDRNRILRLCLGSDLFPNLAVNVPKELSGDLAKYYSSKATTWLGAMNSDIAMLGHLGHKRFAVTPPTPEDIPPRKEDESAAEFELRWYIESYLDRKRSREVALANVAALSEIITAA